MINKSNYLKLRNNVQIGGDIDSWEKLRETGKWMYMLATAEDIFQTKIIQESIHTDDVYNKIQGLNIDTKKERELTRLIFQARTGGNIREPVEKVIQVQGKEEMLYDLYKNKLMLNEWNNSLFAQQLINALIYDKSSECYIGIMFVKLSLTDLIDIDYSLDGAKISNCFNNNLLSVMTLFLEDVRDYHLNAIVINHRTKKLEFFEPHGGEAEYNENRILEKLKKDKDFGELFSEYSVLEATNTCPLWGSQSEEWGYDYGDGLCWLHSLYFMLMRYANPELSQLDVSFYILNRDTPEQAEFLWNLYYYMVLLIGFYSEYIIGIYYCQQHLNPWKIINYNKEIMMKYQKNVDHVTKFLNDFHGKNYSSINEWADVNATYTGICDEDNFESISEMWAMWAEKYASLGDTVMVRVVRKATLELLEILLRRPLTLSDEMYDYIENTLLVNIRSNYMNDLDIYKDIYERLYAYAIWETPDYHYPETFKYSNPIFTTLYKITDDLNLEDNIESWEDFKKYHNIFNKEINDRFKAKYAHEITTLETQIKTLEELRENGYLFNEKTRHNIVMKFKDQVETLVELTMGYEYRFDEKTVHEIAKGLQYQVKTQQDYMENKFLFDKKTKSNIYNRVAVLKRR
jgi:hypothetical protein